MFLDPIQFYFLKLGAHAPLSEDLEKIVQQLGTYSEEGFGLKRTMNSVIITFDNSATKAVLEVKPKPELTDSAISSQMVLTCERTDHMSVNILRNIIRNMNYRVYNPSLGCFNTSDPDLIDLTSFDINPKIQAILKKYKFRPLFNYRNNMVFFAQKINELPIYLINSNLLLHLVEKGDAKFDLDDFSLKVAEDLGHFIALYDKGMIQGSFYEPRIPFLNQSGFELNNIKRNIFVRPIFFKYNDLKQSFEQFRGGSEMRDLLKKGDSIKNYPQKLLERLKHKDKLITAKIMRGVEYEEYKGKLIPRLNIGLYFD